MFDAYSVVTTANTTRYALLGDTADELDFYMRTFGPLDSTGNRWLALTEPKFNWNYACTCSNGGCVTGPVTIYVTLDYTIPVWEPTDDADAVLVDRWRTFQRAVVLHERGHGERAEACGQALGAAFVALPAQTTCVAMDSAVQSASQPVFAECRAAQTQYENETDNGRAHGVMWPPP